MKVVHQGDISVCEIMHKLEWLAFLSGEAFWIYFDGRVIDLNSFDSKTFHEEHRPLMKIFVAHHNKMNSIL